MRSWSVNLVGQTTETRALLPGLNLGTRVVGGLLLLAMLGLTYGMTRFFGLKMDWSGSGRDGDEI